MSVNYSFPFRLRHDRFARYVTYMFVTRRLVVNSFRDMFYIFSIPGGCNFLRKYGPWIRKTHRENKYRKIVYEIQNEKFRSITAGNLSWAKYNIVTVRGYIYICITMYIHTARLLERPRWPRPV